MDRSLDSFVAEIVASGAVTQVDRAVIVNDGLEHVVVILDQAVVARFPRDATSAASLTSEALLLERLSDKVTAPLPIPFHVSERFSLHRMLHGAITTRSSLTALSSVARERLLDEVGRFLEELGGIDPTGMHASSATTSKERLDQLRRDVDVHVAPLLMQHQRESIDALFDLADRFTFNSAPRMIHGDLAPYHILHDTHTGALTGVLDFGVAGVGDPAVDLGCLLACWGERVAQGLAKSWPMASALADGARFVASMLPIEWAVAALAHGSTEMAVAHLGHLALDIAPFGESF